MKRYIWTVDINKPNLLKSLTRRFNKKRSNLAITRFPNKRAHGRRKHVLELSTNIHEMKKEKTRLAKILVPTVIIED